MSTLEAETTVWSTLYAVHNKQMFSVTKEKQKECNIILIM